jgi:hypothetical protein
MRCSVRSSDDGALLLARMEAARRQTRHHLDLVYRQIEARAERITTTQRVRAVRSYGRSRSRWTRSREALLRLNLERLEFERRGEIEPLIRTLARQEATISAFRDHQHIILQHERSAA